jgi:phosphoribosylformimino-5-aminoimidazole carboxamide ribotide isomerase
MIEIIPAIDIIEGKCVRLTRGDYSTTKVYNEDPVMMAREFESRGIGRLHLVDLEGAKSKHVVNQNVLKNITEHTNLKVDFGGGIKSGKDIEIAFEYGASQVNIGSLAVTNPDLMKSWIRTYGPEKIILGADVSEEMIATHGWKKQSDLSLWEFLSLYIEEGIKYVVCTDISKDGMMQGPAIDLYAKIMSKYPEIHLIASGGITTLDDVRKLVQQKIYGAIIGKALYEGRLDLDELLKEVRYAD